MVSDSPRVHTALSSNGQQPSRAWALLCAPSQRPVHVPYSFLCTLGQCTCEQGVQAQPNPGMASSEINIAVIAGVIAAMAFVLVGLLLLMLHYMYRHKGTYHTNEAKGTEFAESADVALQDDPSFQDNGGNSKKEYFI
ncbi:hypothetical protein E5288_WYG000527 [Bos mutus]|uniref:Neurexin/syndecan/glycophorin C domain-containing protein n=1 Tax=Bos mutus TaxID=72004 RepID=A0A6B0QUT7_9CETA|nr:hypothetical protein [Bos mutus]